MVRDKILNNFSFFYRTLSVASTIRSWPVFISIHRQSLNKLKQ